MSLWHTDGGVYLGHRVTVDDDGKAHVTDKIAHYTGDRHVVIIGPNGSGKSRRILLPNLARLVGWSMVVIDVKGELLKMCSEHRERAGAENIVFNPYELFAIPSRGCNQLLGLDPSDDDFPDDAMEQAEGIIEVPLRAEPHWAESSQDFIAALAMYVRLVIPGGTYGDVRALLAQSDKGVRDLIMSGADTDRGIYQQWQQTSGDEVARRRFLNAYSAWTNMRGGVAQDYNPPFEYKGMLLPGMRAAGIMYDWEEIGHKAGRFASISPENRELHSIMSTGLTQSRFLDSRRIRKELSGPAFDFREMKQRPITVWLVVPDRRLSVHAKWLRLTLTAIVQQLLTDIRPGKVPVALICDDAAVLGHLPIIENTVPQMRGYGLKLITVWQGLDLLKGIYTNRWESFIGNAGIFQSFAVQDVVTTEYVSARTGLTTRQMESRNVSLNLHQKQQASFNTSSTRSPFQAPVMLPQEVRAMGEGHTLLFSDRAEGQALRTYLPFPTELPGLEAICALDPARG